MNFGENYELCFGLQTKHITQLNYLEIVLKIFGHVHVFSENDYSAFTECDPFGAPFPLKEGHPGSEGRFFT